MKIGSIVIVCNNFDKILTFWQEALHYIRARVSLPDPKGKGPNLSLDTARADEPLEGTRTPRLHIDPYTSSLKGEVTRLLGLGATRHPQTYDPEDDFIVLVDPDGNLFSVVQT
jgi:catechol 2,3-dioxygenase-like lactoylglutathione lyase family enzyme